MKTTLTLSAATIISLVWITAATAAEPVLSPRAKASAESLRTVPERTTGTIDRSVSTGSPKARELAHSLRKVQSTGASIDLAHGPVPSLSPKDPRYEAVLRELRTREFQIAPLK